MSYLMHIGFDNNCRLSRRVYYFEYGSIRYKLIQNNMRKWQDVLLTIIGGINNGPSKEQAYSVAAEFLSALSWENDSRIKLEHIGGPGRGKRFTLKKAKCQSFTFPRVPFGGYAIGYNISRIPKIETNEQKIALTLFREASSSNNYYLSFLFYWQILEIAKTNPIGWVNKIYKKRHQNKFYIEQRDLDILSIGTKSLGDYLNDDCRHAIAHIIRKPNKRRLRLDTLEDCTRIAVGTRVVEGFAKFYIKNKLQLNKNMYLVRKGSKGFPFYADENYMKKHYCTVAYAPVPLGRIRKKKWH
ncbi:MAG: hypothetical protein HQ547_01135 [Candidatus Omnitrophica bacterium]|nr:hypothetical protein [Candidatus Omnitrophota bacterium]